MEVRSRFPTLSLVRLYMPFTELLTLSYLVILTSMLLPRKHVFRDLRAYVCTFEGCDTGLFEGRSSWFHHELEYHRRVWVCLNCPGRNFADADSFGRHLKKWHSSEQLAILPHTLNANSRPATEVPADACPLCDEWYESMTSNVDGEHESAQQQLVVSLNDFRQHLGSHQEQLALFAVALNVEFGKRGQSHDGSDGAEGGEDIKRMVSKLSYLEGC